MNKRETIEKRIAELDILLASVAEVEEANQKAYHESQNQLNSDLLAHLKDAGYPVNEFTTVNVWTYQKPEDRQVSVRFRNTERGSDLNVDFRNGKSTRFSASGISCSGRGYEDELVQCADYYKMVADVMERLSSKFFDGNMSLFFDTVNSYVSPEYQGSALNKGDLNNEKYRLEQELKVLDLELEVGAMVQLQGVRGGGRWARTYWNDYKVEKITAKTVVLVDNWGTRKVIPNADVANRIRKPEVKAA